MYQRRLTFGESLKVVLGEKYCNFKGRASRSEYWWFYLFSIILSSCAMPLRFISQNAYLVVIGIMYVALVLPTLGVTVRRLHDIGKSGWGYIGFLIIAFLWSMAVGIMVGISAVTGSGGLSPVGVLFFGVGLVVMLVLAVIMIVWLCKPSQPGENKYGMEPYMEN